MAWTAYKTWVPGELVPAADLNTYVGDNGNYLHSTPVVMVGLDEGDGVQQVTAIGTWSQVILPLMYESLTIPVPYIRASMYALSTALASVSIASFIPFS